MIKRVEKGWGYELWIHNDEKYCGKLLFFYKDKKCSLHFHKLKSETFYIESGSLLVKCFSIEEIFNKSIDEMPEIILKAGDKLEIPQYTVHQMTALEDTKLYEFSTQHFDEDSYRIIKGD